jgi:hypothetical protein
MVLHRKSVRFALGLLACAAAATALAAPAAAVKRRAFVTSISGTGNLSTWPGATGATALERADNICRSRAAAGALPNAATYRAWLSAGTTDAYCHVQGLAGTKAGGCGGAALPGAGPWFLANGISNFTGTLEELVGPERVIFRPVMLDEFQNAVDTDYFTRQIWTGTFPTGAGGEDCSDWTTSALASPGAYGDALGSANTWTRFTNSSCEDSHRLLCLEPGASETVTLGWSPGALVFVSSVAGSADLSTWAESGGAVGINAGYAICAQLASAAHLPDPDSFVPFLSTPAVDARDRLTTDGPFRRVDGYAVANTLADLLDGANQNSLHVYEDGRYADDDLRVWTGTSADGTGSASGTCGGWTENASGFGVTGKASAARMGEWTDINAFTCAEPQNLYCFSNAITLFWDGFESGGTARWSATAP